MQNNFFKKSFASDNEQVKSSNFSKPKSKIKIQPFSKKTFKYSIQEENNCHEIQAKEQKLLISNIDLRILECSNFMQKIFILSDQSLDSNYSELQKKIIKYDNIEYNRVIPYSNLKKALDDLILLIKEKYKKFDNKIFIFYQSEIFLFKEIVELNINIFLLSSEKITIPLQKGINYIFFPNDRSILNTNTIIIYLSKNSLISTKGFQNELTNHLVIGENEMNYITMIIDNNYDDNYGIYIHEGTGFVTCLIINNK